jgi:tripartite-type tricarboxylate transporter receptor subunit TctC
MPQPFRLLRGVTAVVLGGMLLGGTASHAQDWPTRPVTLIVPYAAGGSADVPARLFARELSSRLGQQVVVENKPGAGGAVGAAQAVRATPDGYTLLLVGTGPAVLNKFIQKSMSYDPDTQFAPVVLTTEIPHALIVNRTLPVNTLKEFIDYTSSRNGAVTIGHGGTTGQLSALLFLAKTGLKATLVGYRGTGPLVTDVLGGHVDAGFPVFIPPVTGVKSLGITGEQRLSLMPAVPTMREVGTDVVATTWNVMLAPAGAPRDIIVRINAAMNEILRLQTVRDELAKLGARPLGGTPEEAAKLMADESAKWGPIIGSSEIKDVN